MNSLERFRINAPRVVHETIDDEVVMIDLDSGNYYSLRRVGTDIWGFIKSGATIAQIVERITHRYEGARVSIENGVNQLIDELQQENLIIPDNTGEPEDFETPDAQVETTLAIERAIFEAPILQKYTDMQELLLLDPVHEVDEAGWPNVKPDFPPMDD